MGQQIEIDARMKKSKDRYRVLSGQRGGELRYIPSTTGGWSSRLVMIPPDNPQLSAAPGYSQRYDDDGQLVYNLIRPRWMKDADGNTRLDEQGRPIQRQKGHRDIRAKNPYGEGSVGVGVTGAMMRGHGGDVGHPDGLDLVEVFAGCDLSLPPERDAGARAHNGRRQCIEEVVHAHADPRPG